MGGALASKWASAGHTIFLGVRDTSNFKGQSLLENPNTTVHTISEAVARSEVLLMAVPAVKAVQSAQELGNTNDKVIIDAMNVVRGNGPEGFSNTADAILANTDTNDVVKCFNTTGFNNVIDPNYNNMTLDMFTCGESKKGKELAIQLAKDAGFSDCYDIGGNDKFELIEQFAFFWINLAMVQGYGREIGFKLLTR